MHETIYPCTSLFHNTNEEHTKKNTQSTQQTTWVCFSSTWQPPAYTKPTLVLEASTGITRIIYVARCFLFSLTLFAVIIRLQNGTLQSASKTVRITDIKPTWATLFTFLWKWKIMGADLALSPQRKTIRSYHASKRQCEHIHRFNPNTETNIFSSALAISLLKQSTLVTRIRKLQWQILSWKSNNDVEYSTGQHFKGPLFVFIKIPTNIGTDARNACWNDFWGWQQTQWHCDRVFSLMTLYLSPLSLHPFLPKSLHNM